MTEIDHAKSFRKLHEGPPMLLLANCWDAGSARLIESMGARALATTSAGVAWANGYPDGDTLPVDCLVATVRAIARVSRLPLTVDIEGGYSAEPARVADVVAAVIDAGAVGINIEDGAGTTDLFVAKICAAKDAGVRSGVDLFLNARTDVYLKGLAPESSRVVETLSRAARYRAAGADGLFVPALIDRDGIQAIVSQAGLPLNVMVRPGLPPAADLQALGVRRLSAGAAIAQILWAKTAAVVEPFLRDGRSEPLCESPMAYPRLNALFTG